MGEGGNLQKNKANKFVDSVSVEHVVCNVFSIEDSLMRCVQFAASSFVQFK